MKVIRLQMTKIRSSIKVILLCFIFISCTNAIEKYSGNVYESNSSVFISDFEISFSKSTVSITYPKYDCLNNTYNRKNFDTEILIKECSSLDLFFKENKIRVPKKQCIDTYKIINENNAKKYRLINKTTPCYGFSNDLTYIENKDDSKILQFQSQFGLFQAEF